VKTVLTGLLLSFCLCACGTTTTPEDASTGNPDLSQVGTVDMTSASDAAMVGGKVYGADCTTNADCQSGFCDPFQMMAVHKCTQLCTMGCPAPSTGGCNGKGHCQF
jgi:hypothetical protein